MRRSLTLNLHHHARRILAHSNKTRFLSSHTKEALASSNFFLESRIESSSDGKPEINKVLEQWRQEQQANELNPSFIRGIIDNLRDSNRFRKALAVSDWMMEQKLYNREDFTARFHLIEKVFGFQEAEKFFEHVPEYLRDESLYTALLSRYAESGKKSMSKAEATFEKMRELGLVSKTSPYNSITSIYGSMVMRDRVNEILREMNEKNVEVDSVTVKNALRVYDSVSEIASMDKLQLRTALDMARAYLRIGVKEKAIEMLRRVEELKGVEYYDELMKLYGEAGRGKDVYRVWNMYKETRKEDSKGFRVLIGSLLKLDDYRGAETYYKEWECSGLEFDVGIPTMLASFYRGKGRVDKVDELMRNTIRNSKMVTPITPLLEEWGVMKPLDLRELIKNLRDSNQFSKALEVSSWMYEKKVVNLFSQDYADRLDLIEKVLGLEDAEKFFQTSIPENIKDYSIYATLLTMYTISEATLKKAEATFLQMRELGFLVKPSPFQSMISLYTKLGKRIKVNKLLMEMKEKNIEMDSVTKNNVLRVHARVLAIELMEKYMREWVEVDDEKLKLEVRTRYAMAEAYKTKGLKLKAIEITPNKKEVYQLWNKYKKERRREATSMFSNEGYQRVIRALLKLDDVKGAEEVYGEWRSSEGTEFDARIPGLLVSRYCKEDDQVKLSELLNSSRVKLHLHRKFKVDGSVIFVVGYCSLIPLFTLLAFV